MTMVQKIRSFKLKFGTESKRWLATAGMAWLLVLAGCSGEGEGDSSTDSESPVVQAVRETVETPEVSRTPPGFKVHEAVKLADGLIPELSEIPLPSGPVVFEVGQAYDAKIDPRETAVQTVHFTIPPQELFDFYLKSLPPAGFKIKSSVDALTESSQALIEFTDAVGIQGHISFRPGAWSESQMAINLFRSGSVD